jgi:hypothetical protein
MDESSDELTQPSHHVASSSSDNDKLISLIEHAAQEHPPHFGSIIVDSLHGFDIRRAVENLSKNLITVQEYFDNIYTSISLLREGNINRPSGFLGIRIPAAMDRIKKCLKTWEVIRTVRKILSLFTAIGQIFP